MSCDSNPRHPCSNHHNKNYENEKEFCHRHLVAFCLEETLKINVDEVKTSSSGSLIKLDRPEYLRNLLLFEIKK